MYYVLETMLTYFPRINLFMNYGSCHQSNNRVNESIRIRVSREKQKKGGVGGGGVYSIYY